MSVKSLLNGVCGTDLAWKSQDGKLISKVLTPDQIARCLEVFKRNFPSGDIAISNQRIVVKQPEKLPGSIKKIRPAGAGAGTSSSGLHIDTAESKDGIQGAQISSPATPKRSALKTSGSATRISSDTTATASLATATLSGRVREGESKIAKETVKAGSVDLVVQKDKFHISWDSTAKFTLYELLPSGVKMYRGNMQLEITAQAVVIKSIKSDANKGGYNLIRLAVQESVSRKLPLNAKTELSSSGFFWRMGLRCKNTEVACIWERKYPNYWHADMDFADPTQLFCAEQILKQEGYQKGDKSREVFVEENWNHLLTQSRQTTFEEELIRFLQASKLKNLKAYQILSAQSCHEFLNQPQEMCLEVTSMEQWEKVLSERKALIENIENKEESKSSN